MEANVVIEGQIEIPTWEYKYREADPVEANKLGSEGWEICAATESGYIVFKRPTGTMLLPGRTS